MHLQQNILKIKEEDDFIPKVSRFGRTVIIWVLDYLGCCQSRQGVLEVLNQSLANAWNTDKGRSVANNKGL